MWWCHGLLGAVFCFSGNNGCWNDEWQSTRNYRGSVGSEMFDGSLEIIIYNINCTFNIYEESDFYNCNQLIM